jgi:hypothetical protein
MVADPGRGTWILVVKLRVEKALKAHRVAPDAPPGVESVGLFWREVRVTRNHRPRLAGALKRDTMLAEVSTYK